ncbi:HSP20 family protein [Actinomadura hallensis]|uniref:HSP20 family protein n=1 Tax=Actinomadura hallensis TaxID=337895 RepID=A0A543IJN1_9ACTN|nr:Hsp20/alpha crystallin family protein [Actinomadura hallensis]TQM70778.1 HSP20 family protein [Actinomadura hallensis]HLV72549.1 Hsp20/alpha crystallin family protein [Vulgatibacteraceae bacterium]
MLLTSLDPFVQEFERQVDRVFREAGLNGNGTAMPMDGIRRAEDVVLRFDLPGIDPDSIEVTVDRDVLSVTAHREEEIGDGERPFVRERRMGTFARRVRLPDHLDADGVEAAYDNGVLAVRIPVLEKARPRRIAIQHGLRGRKAIKS